MTSEPAPPATPEGADPSMEEILASIRRILNDDDAPAAPAPASASEVPAADDDVLVLDPSMMVSASTAADSRSVPPEPEPALDVMDFESAPAIAETEPMAPPPQASPPPQEVQAATPFSSPDPEEPPPSASDLLGPEATAAAASSVGSLVRTLAAGRATQVYAGGPTLEDVVRAELRPLLRDWLNVNLPPMVERLVRAEIERVVGRVVP
jgi:cell pole-organizing protein PopZ